MRRIVLPNGLTVFESADDTKPGKKAYLELFVMGGSASELEGEEGYAHLVEHLAFGDTEQYPGTSLRDCFSRLGMRLGNDYNGAPSIESSCREGNGATAG